MLASIESAKTKNVVATSDPYAMGTVSEDGRTAYATVSYAKQSIELTDADRAALEEAPDGRREGRPRGRDRR